MKLPFQHISLFYIGIRIPASVFSLWLVFTKGKPCRHYLEPQKWSMKLFHLDPALESNSIMLRKIP